MTLITGYPFEDQDTTETQYRRIMRLFQEPGVEGTPGGGDLAASFPGGMVVRVATGRAHAEGFIAEQGTPAGVDVPVEAAESQARVDRLVATVDPVANTAELRVLKGTRGSLVPPALTRSETGAYDVRLFRFTVGALAPTPTNLVDEREWLSVRLGRWYQENRPTDAEVERFTTGWNLTTNRLETYHPGDDRDPAGWRTLIGSVSGRIASVEGFTNGARVDVVPPTELTHNLEGPVEVTATLTGGIVVGENTTARVYLTAGGDATAFNKTNFLPGDDLEVPLSESASARVERGQPVTVSLAVAIPGNGAPGVRWGAGQVAVRWTIRPAA